MIEVEDKKKIEEAAELLGWLGAAVFLGITTGLLGGWPVLNTLTIWLFILGGIEMIINE